MIRIALVGGIGSGKTFISKLFGYPVFNADNSVAKIYSKNKKIYYKLKNEFQGSFTSFPIKKIEIMNVIIQNSNNIKKISKIIHPEVRKDLQKFLKKNIKKKIVILDIPLFLENKLNRKKDIIVFVQSSNKESFKKVKKRKNFNNLIYENLKKLQFSLKFKKRKSQYVIKNNYNKNLARKNVKDILNRIL